MFSPLIYNTNHYSYPQGFILIFASVFSCIYSLTPSTRKLPSLPLSLWQNAGYSLTEDLGPLLLSQVPLSPLSMQPATAQALGLWLQSHPHQVRLFPLSSHNPVCTSFSFLRLSLSCPSQLCEPCLWEIQ